jgi:hypothetical protein
METISPDLDKNEILRIINQHDYDYKLFILKELKKSLYSDRFDNLLQSTKNITLTLEEITEEVESVRKTRYENGLQVF